MVNSNVKFYFDCRYKIESSFDKIHMELDTHFAKQHFPVDLSEWAALISNESIHILQYEPLNMAAFKSSDPSQTSFFSIQYYIQCRNILGIKQEQILIEINQIFKHPAILYPIYCIKTEPNVESKNEKQEFKNSTTVNHAHSDFEKVYRFAENLIEEN